MKICIVAGGTGGHIVPALAVAEKIKQEQKFFITGKSRTSEKRFTKNINAEVHYVDVKPIVGKGLKSALGLISSFSGLKESYGILKKIDPDVVIGFGGYVSGPVCLAGKILKKKVFIHEQNSVMGFANTIASLFSDKVFVSFKETEAPKFLKRKFVYSSFPLRDKFKEDLNRGLEKKSSLRDGSDRITIFVSGGSQGAVGLNKLFVETIEKIAKVFPDVKYRMRIFHQTGDVSFDWVRNSLSSWDAEVFPFTDEFGFFLGMCDIAVSRGGAGTVFEIGFSKKVSIFVPLPRSAGGHQEKNPKYLFQDSCFIVRQNEKNKFEINLSDLLMNRDLRKEFEEKLKNVHVEDGSFRILNFIRESG